MLYIFRKFIWFLCTVLKVILTDDNSNFSAKLGAIKGRTLSFETTLVMMIIVLTVKSPLRRRITSTSMLTRPDATSNFLQPILSMKHHRDKLCAWDSTIESFMCLKLNTPEAKIIGFDHSSCMRKLLCHRVLHSDIIHPSCHFFSVCCRPHSHQANLRGG